MENWSDTPKPEVDASDLALKETLNEPAVFIETMYKLIYLAFKTDSTRVATYQIGRENGAGVSDRLARAVGFNLAHKLTHDTKLPGGWERQGI